MRTMRLLTILIFCLAVPTFQAQEGQKPEEKTVPATRPARHRICTSHVERRPNSTIPVDCARISGTRDGRRLYRTHR